MTNTPQWVIKKILEVKEKQLKKLDLTYRSWKDAKLTKIPPEIFELEWLEELDLSGNNIPELPNILSHFPKLILFGFRWQENKPIPNWIKLVPELKIDLSSFKISNKLPDLIFNFKNLKHLNLSGNKLISIPDHITKLTNLNSLDLSVNKLTYIPNHITKLTHLKSLDLSGNQLNSIPTFITKLTNLKSLNLSSNHLTSIPDSITQLTNLNSLDLSGNQLSSIPIFITLITNLNSLNLSSNQLTSIHIFITQLANLNSLDLSYNQLADIPDYISRLTSLKSLDLSSNQLTSIPDYISRLTNLNSLNLSGNQLISIPNSITQLTHLKTLNLSSNKLISIPNPITQLTHLKTLNLSSNKLTFIPDSITKLTHLNSLNLSRNKLNSIPDYISKLTYLKSLDLSGNELIYVTDSISQLINLNELFLNYNQLTSIPDSIFRITHLNSLDLSGNKLISIPNSISQLTHLKSLDLSKNPLEKPPIEIAEKGISAINEYFRQLIEEGKDYIYEAKLIIVGAGEAGKTTLAKKIINPKYKLHSQEASTEGIEILQWSFPIEDKQGEKRNFRVNIWDFGGQEIYHTTHQFFLTKRSLYILVADTRKEDTDFPYWLNITQLLSNRSPLIIVKNEKGDRTIQVNESQLRGQFLNLKEVLACNLANSRGLNDILKNCQFHLTKLPHVGDTLPKTWKQVREILEKDTRNYISLQEYLRICEKNGFKKYENKLQLSSYLHDLGIILHFQEDWILSQTVILKPEWGTDAVYKVLDNKEVINNLGEFSNHKLQKIWHEQKYTGKQIELLQLMKKFQLCYQLPGTNDTYIAPQLLTREQPTYNWNGANNLILRYTYEFMPKGIITQFIVAMHQKIDNQKCVWRTGVILNQNQTKAEVIEFYDKREITVKVSGENKRDLITIITYELDKIHDSYGERLKVDKLIPCNCSECKGQQEPHFYKFDVLQKAKQKRKEVQCQKSFEMVSALNLIDDVIDMNQLGSQDKQENHKPINIGNIQNLNVSGDFMSNINQHHSGSGDNAGRDKNTTNNSNNDNRSMNIGDIGGDFSPNASPIMSDNAESIAVTQEKNSQPKKESKIIKVLTVIAAIATIVALFFNGIFNNEAKDFFDKLLDKDAPETSKPQ